MDIRTLAILLGITNVLQVIVLFLQYKANKTYHGIGWWVLGSASSALGFALLLLRDRISIELISIIVTNALLILSAVFQYIGIMRFLDKQENRWIVIVILAVYLLSFSYFTYVRPDLNARSVLFSVIATMISFVAAHGLFVNKTRSITASANFIAAVFFAQGVYFVFRALDILTVAPANSIFDPTVAQTSAFLESFIEGILLTIGLIIMVNQRLSEDSREAKEHFELIFNTGPDSTLITRLHDGLVLDINEGFTALTGFTRAETIGKSSLDIHIWKNPADRQKLVTELSEKGFCENMEAIFQRKDGSPVTGIVSAKIITLQGQPHIISVTRDITARKQAEAELHRANLELTARNEELDAFTHTVAHDIKNPVGLTVNYADLLLHDYRALSDQERERFLRTIARNGHKISSILEELLLLAQVRQVDVPSTPLDMASVVAEAQQRLADMFDQSQATLLAPSTWPVALGYAAWVEEIWVNYLSNAIKYGGQPPRIELGAQILPDHMLRFWIRDNGDGIAPEEQAQLFKPFTRLDQVRAKGHGLGLSIVHRIADKLGGQAGVESAGQPGSGSTFYFTLPAA
jgi:PAS domain S-box-containing protein